MLHIHNAAFFSANRPPISSCLKAEIRRSESSRHRKRTKQEQRQRQLYRHAYRTAVVPANNQVSFLFHPSPSYIVCSCITCYYPQIPTKFNMPGIWPRRKGKKFYENTIKLVASRTNAKYPANRPATTYGGYGGYPPLLDQNF